MEYTIEVYKSDKRTKEGERLMYKMDIHDINSPKAAVEAHYAILNKGHRVEVHETFVTRTNILSNTDYQERYDTPRCCSPSSEIFWSM
jgi:hypothetical protein